MSWISKYRHRWFMWLNFTPRGVHRVMNDLTRVSEELGLFDIPPQVCVEHMSHIPCRKGNTKDPCVFSADPAAIKAVTEYHRQ